MRKVPTCFSIILLLSSCSGNKQDASDEMPSLYPSPQTVALNIDDGYFINYLTGDSIFPIINSSGDTILSGIPIPIKGKVIHPDSIAQPVIIPVGEPEMVQTNQNVYKIPENLTVIPVNKGSLKTFTPGVDTSSFVLVNSAGDTVTTGIPIPARGKVVPCIQPQPVKALLPQVKDNASINTKYLDVDQGMNLSLVPSILEDSHGNLWFGTWGGGVSRYNGETFTHFTEREGLSNNSVLSILEDRQGNLWFGTFGGGVSMYNGETFTHFTEKEGLSNNTVVSLLEDRNNNIWLGTNGGGVSVYNGNTFTHFTEKEGLSNNSVISLLEDRHGNLWLGTFGGGVSVYDGNTFTHFTEKEGLSNNIVKSLLEDRHGNLWFGTFGGGVSKYNGETFKNFTEKEGLSNNNIWSLLEDRHGNLWFGTEGGGVSVYNGETFTHFTEKEGLSNNTVLSILEDLHGNLWLGTFGGGVSRYNGETFKPFTQKIDLSNNGANSILEDHVGNLWFGTFGGGVSKYNGETIWHFTEKEGLINNIVWTILEDRHGNLWFGTELGVSVYNGETFTNFTEKEGLSNNNVNSILEDRHGNLWFGTFGGGVSSYNGETFTHFTEKEGFSSNNVISMLEDRHGNLWFGTFGGGVSRYNGEVFTNFTEKEGLSNNIVLSIMEDRQGNLWFATDYGGVSRFNGETFTHFTEKEGLINNTVVSILEDSVGNIWLSTVNGLNQLLIDSLNVSSIKNHLSASRVKKNSEEDTFYNPVIHTYSKQDGLKGIDFNANSVILDSKNRIWWGSGKGLTMLRMNKFIIPVEPPTLQLNRLEINEQYIDYRQMKDIDQMEMEFSGVARFHNYPLNLELPYNHNHLAFHFSAVDWSGPHKIKYSYKMEDFDDNWSKPTSESKAIYRNLSFGTYTFKLRAVGGAQNWSLPFEYTFTILPPFWFTWWAYFIYGSIFILLLLWYRRFLMNRTNLKTELKIERIQKEKVQDLNRMKTRFFTNISHEFRTPLTLLLGPLEDILKEDGSRIETDRGIVEMMKRNAKRLQRLINQLLDISRLESGKMKITATEGDLIGTIRTIASAFLSLAESKKIEYIIHSPKEKSSCVFDHDKLEKIITNLLSNAFKYTPRGGTVKLNLDCQGWNNDQDPQMVIIRVKDTGRGIAEDQLPMIFDRFSLADAADIREDDSIGIGLALTKELIELLKGTIEVRSEVGKGTEFIVTLPVSTGSYPEEVGTGIAFLTEEEANVVNRIDPSDQNLSFDETFKGLKKWNKTEILVVEDNEDLRRYICDKLTSEYSVIEAVNGREGVRLTQENIPDLVISDLMMPVLGGMELCRELKNDQRTSHIPIVILTAKSDKRSKLDGLETGADDYLIKPFDAEELQVRVKNLIIQRRKLREVFRKQLLEHKSPTDKRGQVDKLINRLLETFEKKYSEYDFSVDDMGKEMLMSRAQFYRKVNALTGTSPNELLRVFRIRKAASLLESDDHNIAEIMYEVGFRSTSHFAKSFRKYYGKNPSEYRDSLLREK